MTSAASGMYYQFSIPLGLTDLIQGVIGTSQSDPNTPQVSVPTANRIWFSQPRPGTDPTTEVITVNFKLPLSVSEVGWDALRVGSHIEVWYQDRQNNWRQVLDDNRIPVALNLSTSSAQAWYTAHYYCYPIVAKALQFRFTRVYDATVGTMPYCVGMRNGLIRRNIYTRSDGTQGIEPQQDTLGNTFTSYIKDWDASKAIDNDPTTFWRSMPMPDPNAVCWLALDMRETDGSPQLMDTVYIDPVYTGQTLNLYYSNDDTMGTLKLSPVTAVPTIDENTEWQQGQGRWDISTDVDASSDYEFPMAWGPLVSQDAWVGIEWSPDFDPTNGPAENPVLFNVTPTAATTGQFCPKIYYDVGAGEVILELTDGTTVQTYSCPLSPLFTQYGALRIVVGWTYAPDTVYMSVVIPNGTVLGTLTNTTPSLPPLMSFDGSIGFTHFRGLFTAHVIKLEDYHIGQASFQANAQIYVSPDPVQPDPSGNIPATTLDNAIYAAAWTMQENGTGGNHESKFENKTWTPIWSNYTTQKGNLFFPQSISLKYLKLEFTGLTQEPYPVYDSGIQVTYDIFPVSVTQQAAPQTILGAVAGLLTAGADVVLSGVGSVNWLNPATVNNAVNSVFGQTVQPVNVTTGPGTTVTSLPNTVGLDLTSQTRQEVSSPWVYKRSPINATTLAGQAVNTATNAVVQTLPSATSSASTTINSAFTAPASMTPTTSTSSLPAQGADYWVFPGGNLRMPANVMNGLTQSTQVVTARASSSQTRLRFNTTSVHRYITNTVTLDAAVGYFAGLREVQPLVTTYIAELDPINFTFTSYDPSQWVFNNITALASGPITTAGALYEVLNPGFDQDLSNWTQAQGSWTWDGTVAHWYPGTATVVADGTEKELVSSEIDVTPGTHIDASVWVSWSNFAAAANSEAIQLQALFYNDGTYVSNLSAGLIYANWPATTPETDTNPWVQIVVSAATDNEFLVPAGVNQMNLALVVTADATAGQLWFDTVNVGSSNSAEGTIYKDFQTTSTFARVQCSFSDSGVVRSDDMWAQEDPDDTNISSTALAYYTDTIPDQIPAGTWGDTFATWGDTTITWGEPQAVVAINVDPDRIYDGKRVLHFTRAGGAGEAGIKVRQLTNFVSDGLFRIGCVFFKPNANANQITLQLRRVSDGVYIYQETFNPVVGYWYEYVTGLIEIPTSEDQIYTVEMVLTGDAADEIYLNDLYCEIALIRYFVRLGGEDQFLHDVTALAYADSAIVSTTDPVQEFSVEAAILSPRAFAYGMTATPTYLQ